MQRSNRKRDVGILCIAVAVLAVVVGVGSAFAETSEDSNPLPSAPNITSAVNAAPELSGANLTDREAAVGVPLEDLGRDQAESLLSGVFGAVVEAPSGIYDELQGAEILSPNLALLPASRTQPEMEIEGEETDEPEAETSRSAEEPPPSSAPDLSGAALVHSTVPLQVDDGNGTPAPVDLTLAQSEGGLRPVEPLVDVRVPTELGDGVELPGLGIEVELAGVSGDRSPSVTEDNVAFFPNVAQDTDFAVTPAPSGFETFSQLRGPESPTIQVYKMNLPSDASLLETDSGGAEVVEDGKKLLVVQPPVAIDATGSEVSAVLEVDGSALILKVDPPQGVAYPILVDPLWQTYEWAAKKTTAGICSSSTGAEPGGSCEKREEWGYDVLVYPWAGLPHLRADSGWGPAQPGIFVTAEGQQRAGDHAAVIYTVPRYFKESPPPTSYIKKLNVSNVTWQALGSSTSPYLFMGIWDYVNQGWIQFFSHTGQVEHGINDPAYVYEFKNEQPNVNGKVAQVGIWATEATAGSNARVYAGSASVELGDSDAPQAPVTSSQSQWVNESPALLSFTAADTGLGMYAMNASTGPNNPAGPYTWKQKLGCVGIGNAACPRTWKSTDEGTPALTYDPSVLPNGFNYVALVAEDPVGNKSASSWAEVRVDHRSPALALTGNLTEQSTVGTELPEYTLNYSAADGDDAAATAQTPIGTPGTGSGQLERPQGVAVDDNGNIWVSDRINQRIVSYDKNGNLRCQIAAKGSGAGQINEPRGIAISPLGNVYVAEAGTNKRIQQFTPSCGYVSQITNAAFIEPWGIAFGPDGRIWVTDQSAKKVLQFKGDGTFLQSMNTTQLVSGGGVPYGIDVDALGNAWVALQSTHKVVKVNSSLSTVFSFGSEGTGNGQFRGPFDIAVAASGNILVTDDLNARVQVFKPDGSFLRQFGTAGAGSGQLSGPRGIDVGPDNNAYVADSNNRRIALWTHADQDPQSGAAKLQVKLDGSPVVTKEPGCATKNCTISGSWTLDANQVPAGAHKVEVTTTDGVGLQTTKTLDVQTHGDYAAPKISLSGTMTEQAGLGNTLPSYKLKAVAADEGSAEERPTGVNMTWLVIDGKTVGFGWPECETAPCTVSKEWSLNANNWAPGPHTVEVRAMDEVGHESSKTLTWMVERDTTAPTLDYLSGFYTAPSGWLEQKDYGVGAYVSDAGGYGVTSVQLKIDGEVVQSAGKSCPTGECEVSFGFGTPIDMEKYSGGAHPAELIATDGAGNTRKRSWTINVDPEGHITATEATDTLEALATTTDANPIGPSREEEIYGTAQGLGLAEDSEYLVATGSAVPSTVSNAPSEGITMKVLPDSALAGACLALEPADPGMDAEVNQPNPEPEETEFPTPSCEVAGEEEIEEGFHLENVNITPVNAALGSNANIDGAAALAPNTSENVDTITRPLYEGLLTFKAIRASDALQAYSWQVDLAEGQTLKLLDAQHATVYYASGQAAFSIMAEPAHDAVGTSVPTQLSVSGNDTVTLHVNHNAANYTYPILAGAGWQGGFISEEIPGPMDEQELREERERIEQEEREALEAEEEGDVTYIQATDRWDAVSIMFQGPPIANLAQSGPDKGIEKYTFGKKFKFRTCYYQGPDAALPELKRRESIEEAVRQCKGRIGWRRLEAKLVLHGWYRTNTNMRAVWILKGNLHCDKWGHDLPAMVNCGKEPGYWQPEGTHIQVFGDYRFWPGDGPSFLQPPTGAGTSACVTIRGTIEYGKGTDPQEPILRPARQGTPCDWPYG